MTYGRTIAIGCAAVAVVAVLANWSVSHDIERDVTDRVGALLRDTGQAWAKLDIDGRDVTVTGRAPDERTQAQLAQVVRGVWGVRSVDDRSSVPPISTPFFWKVSKPPPRVSLTGAAPSPAVRAAIAEEARRVLGQRVEDNSDLARGAPSGPWEEAARIGLAQVALLNHGEAVLNDTTLVVTGQAPSAAIAFEVQRELARSMPDGFDGRASLSTPTPRPVDPIASAEACQSALDRMAASSAGWFESDGPFLQVSAYRELDAAAIVVRRCAAFAVEIVGTSREAGDAERDRRIGRIQALTVRDYLVAAGADEQTLTVTGRAADAPVPEGEAGAAVPTRGVGFTVRSKDRS